MLGGVGGTPGGFLKWIVKSSIHPNMPPIFHRAMEQTTPAMHKMGLKSVGFKSREAYPEGFLAPSCRSKLLMPPQKKLSKSTATEHANSTSGAKDPRLEKMFQEACSNAPPKMQSLLQELHALGRYPTRYKQPANKMEKDSDSLAQKLTKARSSFTPAAQKYVEAVRSTSNATEHAQHDESAATEHASSTSGAKHPRLEKMFQEACSLYFRISRRRPLA